MSIKIGGPDLSHGTLQERGGVKHAVDPSLVTQIFNKLKGIPSSFLNGIKYVFLSLYFKAAFNDCERREYISDLFAQVFTQKSLTVEAALTKAIPCLQQIDSHLVIADVFNNTVFNENSNAFITCDRENIFKRLVAELPTEKANPLYESICTIMSLSEKEYRASDTPTVEQGKAHFMEDPLSDDVRRAIGFTVEDLRSADGKSSKEQKSFQPPVKSKKDKSFQPPVR